MNKVVLMGRLTKDPEVRYTQTENSIAITRYILAVDRQYKRDGEPTADFIPCVAFGKQGEFAEKYFHKGLKITVSGRIQTGRYQNKEGQWVYTTEVITEQQEFAELKNAGNRQQDQRSDERQQEPEDEGFTNIPDGLEADLPFA